MNRDYAEELRRNVRILSLLDGCRRTALYPTPVAAIFTISYLADALAAVTELEALEDIVLKRSHIPRSPKLLRSLHRMVGMGLLIPSNVRYGLDEDGWGFEASYAISDSLAAPVLEHMRNDGRWNRQLTLVREISVTVAGLGPELAPQSALVDASYSDPLKGDSTVLDLASGPGGASRTATATSTIRTLAQARIGQPISDVESVSLYVRHLYGLVGAR